MKEIGWAGNLHIFPIPGPAGTGPKDYGGQYDQANSIHGSDFLWLMQFPNNSHYSPQ